MTREVDATPPPGFAPVPMGGPFGAHVGPLYLSHEDGVTKLGLRVLRQHCNTMGNCHGGVLSTFADMMMPVILYPHERLTADPRFLPTVSLQLDFLGPARLGDWLEGTAEVLKVTRSVVFAHGVARVNGTAVLRCSGIYKLGPPIPPGSPGMYTNEVQDIAHPARSSPKESR